MKKIAKITAVFAALVLALAFVACSEEDDPSVVSEWATYQGDKTMTFFDNGTVIARMNGESTECPYTSTLGTTTVGSVITLPEAKPITIRKDDEGLYFWFAMNGETQSRFYKK